MGPTDNSRRTAALRTLAGRVAFLCFGVALLTFLIAIERQNWFELRPASGTAAAMANAAVKPVRG